MSNKVTDKENGLASALRYIAEHSPVSLSIAVIVMGALYLFEKTGQHFALLQIYN